MEKIPYAQLLVILDIAEKINKGCIIGSSSSEETGQVMDFEDWKFIFRINKYNFSAKCLEENGGPPHTDAGFVTIIQEDDDVGGLELFHPPSNSFVPCAHLPDSLFINTGDVAHVSFFRILFIDVPNPM